MCSDFPLQAPPLSNSLPVQSLRQSLNAQGYAGPCGLLLYFNDDEGE